MPVDTSQLFAAIRAADPKESLPPNYRGHEVIAETPAGPVILATVGPNEIVGEMGILSNAPRNATICAKDRLIALRISKEPFMRMVREFPNIAVSIMQELAHRLDSTNNQLRTARAEVNRLRETAGIAA